MAQVKLSIGGRSYDMACRPGEEAHYEALAATVDAKAREAQSALGGMSETRQLLLAALLLADDLAQGIQPAPIAAPEGVSPAAVAALAQRIETLAEALEKSDTNP